MTTHSNNNENQNDLRDLYSQVVFKELFWDYIKDNKWFFECYYILAVIILI